MNYPYTSIQLIDGDVKAVVNKEVEPKIISPSKITPLIFYFIYNLWQQKHEVFEFASAGQPPDQQCGQVREPAPVRCPVTAPAW